MKKIPVRRIDAQKELGSAENFSIRDVGEILAGNDMEQDLHRHDFYYILILNKGAGEHDIDFTSSTISDNCLYFMRPGQVHRLLLKAESAGYLMQFKPGFYLSQEGSSQLLRKASCINHYRLDAEGSQKLHTLLANVNEEYAGKREQYLEVIKASMSIFFIELVRQPCQDLPGMGKGGQYMQERLEELLALIEIHIFSQKQVAEYATMMHISTYQLNAVTRETLGKTCSALITERIILEAKRYLLATASQVGEIADLLGYEDVSYFIRFFKKHTGYSPEVFRHNFR